MNRWMKIAYDEALKGIYNDDGGPFGAVIVKNGKLIAKSHNKVLVSKDPTSHAEINVIREASKKLGTFDLSEAVLYTTCKPCPMCMGAVFWARIKTVYYGADENDATKAGFDDKLFYEMIEGKKESLNLVQVDREINVKLFEKFLQKDNYEIY